MLDRRKVFPRCARMWNKFTWLPGSQGKTRLSFTHSPTLLLVYVCNTFLRLLFFLQSHPKTRRWVKECWWWLSGCRTFSVCFTGILNFRNSNAIVSGPAEYFMRKSNLGTVSTPSPHTVVYQCACLPIHLHMWMLTLGTHREHGGHRCICRFLCRLRCCRG